MAKKIKNYTQFMENAKSYNNRFKFSEVYNKVVALLRQGDLEQEQRDKLIYILNVLYSSGSYCWEYDGALIDKTLDDEHEDYFFYSNSPRDILDNSDDDMDALSNFYTLTSKFIIEQDFNSFQDLIKNGIPLTDYEKKSLKKNKTFDEWVDILMDKNYTYPYKSRKDVANQLLCVIGNGYEWNSEGYLEDRSEAKTDWKNAKLPTNVQKVLDDIFSVYEVELTYETYRNNLITQDNKRKEEKRKTEELYAKYSKLRKITNDDDEDDEFDFFSPKKGYSKYYPISRTSDIYVIVDEESQNRLRLNNIHPSYAKAAKEICEDIMAHKDEEEKDNVEFAIKGLAYFGDETYKKMLPKKHDKYEILSELKMIFADIIDYGIGEVRLDDTAKNEYASNNYYVNVTFNSLKEGSSVNIEFLKGTPIYDDLKTAFERMLEMEGIYYHTFYFYDNKIHIEIIANEKYVKSAKLERESNENFEKLGFEVGFNSISLYLDKLETTLTIRRPKPMSHMPEKGGYYSNALYMDVKKGTKLYSFHIDERNFNNIYLNTRNSDDFTQWILDQHEAMKKSDPKYGYGKREGQACLYAHDFMLWLKDNQQNYKK